MTRGDRLVIVISAVLVLLLGATSAYFFIAKPLSAPTSSSASADDEDDEPADEEPEPEEAPEFTLADLQSLADSADLGEFGVGATPDEFELANSAASVLGSWEAGPDAADGCYGIYAASALLGEGDDPGSRETATGIAGSIDVTDFLSEGYVGTFGRVLDSEDDALDLLDEFQQAADDCDSGFAVTRDDGLLAVAATDYGRAAFEVPDGVEAYTIDYTMDADGDFLGFRVHILQRGNAVIASFAIVKSASTFDVNVSTDVAEAIAAEFAEL